MIQSGNLTFKTVTVLEEGRFVTITPATDSVAYTPDAGSADGVTISKSMNGVVAVQLLKDLSKSFWVEAAGNITVGDNIAVGSEGRAILRVSPQPIVAIAKTAGVAGSYITGYNR